MYRVGERVLQAKRKLHVNAYSGEEFHNLKEGPGGCQMLRNKNRTMPSIIFYFKTAPEVAMR